MPGASGGTRWKACKPRRDALFWGYVAQALAGGATAVALFGGANPVLVYALAAVGAVSVTITRPTMAAFAPSLARAPEQLTAINVVSSWTESVSVLVAPAVAGALLAVGSSGTVFAVTAGVVAVSAVLVRPFPGPPPAGQADDAGEPTSGSLGTAFSVLRRERYARVLVIALCADFVALGALDVLYPELAIGVLERGESWAGYLNAAFGAGATLAIAFTVSLVGKPRLVPSLLAGLGLYVAAFALLAAYPTAATALLLLALAGAGRVVFDVTTRTLLQRVAPTDVLARIFGLLEGLAMAGLAVGSLVVAGLVAVGGAALGLLGIGLLLPLAALVAGRALLEVDRHATVPVVEINLLRAMPLFALLPAAQVEALARSLERVDAAAGTDIVVQGAPGDRFFVIADGEVEVIRDGAVVARLTRGDGFGEIALLHGVARTATCRATCPSMLYALDHDTFLTTLTGHAHADAEARRPATGRSREAGATSTVR
ncbi:MAG: cyclic nucleotide-binding domain-containing protein [Thermoleophilia bacterium]|nr:cyclic nucleotide-binding domain-containing protein [Thermoleophilia bacterium]